MDGWMNGWIDFVPEVVLEAVVVMAFCHGLCQNERPSHWSVVAQK